MFLRRLKHLVFDCFCWLLPFAISSNLTFLIPGQIIDLRNCTPKLCELELSQILLFSTQTSKSLGSNQRQLPLKNLEKLTYQSRSPQVTSKLRLLFFDLTYLLPVLWSLKDDELPKIKSSQISFGLKVRQNKVKVLSKW